MTDDSKFKQCFFSSSRAADIYQQHFLAKTEVQKVNIADNTGGISAASANVEASLADYLSSHHQGGPAAFFSALVTNKD